LEPQDVKIFLYFLKAKFAELKQIAIEIDEEYSNGEAAE